MQNKMKITKTAQLTTVSQQANTERKVLVMQIRPTEDKSFELMVAVK